MARSSSSGTARSTGNRATSLPSILRAGARKSSSSPAIMAELGRLLPRGIIDSLALVGTAAQVVERLRKLAGAGIQEAIIWPFPKDGQETEDFMAKLARDVLPHVAGDG